MLESYLPILMMISIGALFALFMGKVNEFIGPRRPSEEKLSTYESGMEPVQSARERFPIKFYLVAMLFIVFDIEVVFLYPWAVSFRQLGVAGFVTMFVFIAVLLIGYYYLLKKGALEWD
jgi:NADH-quinone oxidoreductase subunit A